jgi:succinate dehydrogenase / fumarate reductase iron-sulfur subunit
MESTAQVEPGLSESSRKVTLRILRQDGPDQPSRWEDYIVPRKAGMSVISCLGHAAAFPIAADGKSVSPVAYESGCLEETCGACAMLINGRVRQACSAMVDDLRDEGNTIILEPLSKFPLVRDLIVDRKRFFDDLKRVSAWTTIDGTCDLGPGRTISQKKHAAIYPLSLCIGCGCCMEACPQYTPANHFVGAAVINQARVFNELPTGAALKEERLEALMEEGGVAGCGKSGNCVQVCPKKIPLMESIAAIGRQATIHAIRKFFSQ